MTSTAGGASTGAESSAGTPADTATPIDRIANVAEAGGWTQHWHDGLVRLAHGGRSVVVAYNDHGEVNTFAADGRQVRARDKLQAVLSALQHAATMATAASEPAGPGAEGDPAGRSAELDLDL